MKNLFETARVEEVKTRLGQLRPDSERQWGKMTAPQMVAHCSGAMELALGESLPPRVFLGRIIGGLIKPKVVGNDDPIRKNAPTAKSLVIQDDRNLDVERKKLLGLIDRFSDGGPAGCTKHPHTFFGPMTPDEWATLMYKHLDHHLRQFGA